MQTSPREGVLGAEPGAQAWPVERPVATSRRATWGWWARLLGVAAVMVALAVLVVLPLTWRIPEPSPIRLDGMQGQVAGTYLQTGEQLFKLVPYADRLPALPHNLPVAATSATFLVRARQLDVPAAYALLTFSGDRAVPVERARRDVHTIALTPLQPLAAGAYYVKAAKDGADRADEYFYFRVE